MRPCTEWIETMNAVLDGEATPEQADALSAHLGQCPACAALFADLKAIRAESDALLVQAPEGFTASVMAAVAAEGATVSPTQARKKTAARWRSWAAMAAVFALVVGVGARQTLLSGTSSAPAVQDMAQPDTAARSGSTAGQEPAPQSVEPSYGAVPANRESTGGASFKSAQPVQDSAQSEALTDLRAAMELVVERVCGESGYTPETEYVFHLSGLSPYCDFRLLDGESVIDEGRVTFTGLSPNRLFYRFAWSWEGQSEEEADLFRYAVPLELDSVIWAGEAEDIQRFELMLEEQ